MLPKDIGALDQSKEVNAGRGIHYRLPKSACTRCFGTGRTPCCHAATTPGVMKPRILVISFTNLAKDPRVNRQIRFLREKYHVIAAGTGDPHVSDVQYVHLEVSPRFLRRMRYTLLPFHIFEGFYWSSREVRQGRAHLADLRPDLVIANDVDALPLGLRMGNGAPVIFDAHEYSPREREGEWAWRMVFAPYRRYLCDKYIRRASAMITVCPGIADLYAQDTGVKPIVMTNAPDYEHLKPMKINSPIRMVHHGNAMRNRKIENMIKTIQQLDERFSLDLVLVNTDARYLRQLQELAKPDPRIRFLPPVPMLEIPRFLNQYDIGIYLLEPTNFNDLHSLPNKFFEFIQARLAVAIGPSPEMARLVRENDVGVVSEDFTPEKMARALRPLNQEMILHFKNRAEEASRKLSADSNRKILLDLVDRTLQVTSCAASQQS